MGARHPKSLVKFKKHKTTGYEAHTLEELKQIQAFSSLENTKFPCLKEKLTINI